MLNYELQTENIDYGTKKLSVLVVGKGLTACIVTSAIEALGLCAVNTDDISPYSGLFHSCDQSISTEYTGASIKSFFLVADELERYATRNSPK